MENLIITPNEDYVEGDLVDWMKLVIDNEVAVTVHFNNEDQKRQLVQYLSSYDISDIGTILNLINWAKGRNMKVEVKVIRWHTLSSWLMRLIILPVYINHPQGHTLFPLKKYSEK